MNTRIIELSYYIAEDLQLLSVLAICSLYLLLHDARSKKDLNKVIIFADVRFYVHVCT